MPDPLPLALLVAGALTLLGIAVTLMLWRTVHGHHENGEHRNPRVKDLLQDLEKEWTGENQKVRRSDDKPLGADEMIHVFEKSKAAGDEYKAVRSAAGLQVLGKATGPHMDYLSEHKSPVDSHKWKTLSESLLRGYVFSPRQDPSIDALSALVSGSINFMGAKSLDELGLKTGHMVAGPGEGPEFMLTLTRCAQALGLALPPVYVDETSKSGLDILWTKDRSGPRVLFRIGGEAASIPATGARSFVCGATLTLLHPSLLLTLFFTSPGDLRRALNETRLFLDEHDPDDAGDLESISGIVDTERISRVEETIGKVIQERGGWPTETELNGWWSATQETCFRVGLVLAGDLREAETLIGSFKKSHSLEKECGSREEKISAKTNTVTRNIMLSRDPGQAMENLVGFFLSDAYESARKNLLGQLRRSS